MISIKFNTDYAAYRDSETGGIDLMSVADSVSEVANDIRNGFKSGNVIDVNGNKVGSWSIIGD